MSVELLRTLSFTSLGIGLVLLVIAIALFRYLDIPKIYGDLSGRTARKAIEEIRQNNASTGTKGYHPSVVNNERGKVTEKIGVLNRNNKPDNNSYSVGTEKLNTEAAETTVLTEEAAETTVLNKAGNETTVLYTSDSSGETASLNIKKEKESQNNATYYIDAEMSFTDSKEIIE